MRVRHFARRVRERDPELADDAVTRIGRMFARAANTALLYPHRREQVELPGPIHVGTYSFDVVLDLIDYTGLARSQVEWLLRRKYESFRSEWHAFPEGLRTDQWFYTSSRTYLFANAVHFAHGTEAELVGQSVERPGPILDFGGGSGNLSLALAASGYDVDYFEISALQKDFVRFRLERYGLTDRVQVLDRWQPIRRGNYGAVAAFDVLEHLPNLRETLVDDVVPSLLTTGFLIESSPFVRTSSNPMHHDDALGLEAFLAESGFQKVRDERAGRVWRRG
jgi:2-polyprenyl-3-methyl-5-hydroxy-6-metoxy-1,4-benzoquinol methylase